MRRSPNFFIYTVLLFIGVTFSIKGEARYCKRGSFFHDSGSSLCQGRSTNYCFSRKYGYRSCGSSSSSRGRVSRIQRYCKKGNYFYFANDCGNYPLNYCFQSNRGYHSCGSRELVQSSVRARATEAGSLYATGGSIAAGVRIETSDAHSCLPASVKNQLNAMASMGWSVSVLSAHRAASDNKRRGGAKNSLHIPCRAVDFRVNNKPKETVAAYLRNNRIGGLGIYCTGRFHIDNGPVRSWGSCPGIGAGKSFPKVPAPQESYFPGQRVRR